MPISAQNAKRKTQNANKAPKFLLPVTCYLLLVTFLSGCSAIGFNKPAALQVTSTPEASVFLDGKHLGKTPFISEQLKSGEHELKITAEDAKFVSKISLQESTLTVINRNLAKNFLAQSGETLTLQPGKKGIFIISSPNQATVTIDGKFVGQTPVLLENIEENKHMLSVSKVGYATREIAVETNAKYQLHANVTLASEIAKQLVSQTQNQPKIQRIEITKAPQGFLRVRQDPIATSVEIGRVKTGDELEVLQEIKDWVKIVFEDKQGWIQSQYTKKLP